MWGPGRHWLTMLNGGSSCCSCSLRKNGRSIYPDEFDNFVERMEVISNNKSKKYSFDLDVIKPLLDVVLDTSLGSEVSRSRYFRRRATADACKQ